MSTYYLIIDKRDGTFYSGGHGAKWTVHETNAIWYGPDCLHSEGDLDDHLKFLRNEWGPYFESYPIIDPKR